MPQSHADRKVSQPFRPAPAMSWTSRHTSHFQSEALYAVGELALFTLMWRPIDFERGLVTRCSTCFEGPEARQAAAFQQPTKKKCPDCYGTTYEGGFRAQIVRPTIMADRNAETTDVHRGVVTIDSLAFETTPDFTLHKGDYLFRFDNTRFQCEEKKEAIIRTGFASPQSQESFSGLSTAHLEDPTSVAFAIPPLDPTLLRNVLSTLGGQVMPDLDTFSLVRPNGYLMEGVPVLTSGTGLGNIATGYGPPGSEVVAPYYLDLDTGILYEAGE